MAVLRPRAWVSAADAAAVGMRVLDRRQAGSGTRGIAQVGSIGGSDQGQYQHGRSGER